MSQYNVRLNGSKCKFLQNQVTYLGHLLGPSGIHPLQKKVDAIVNAPRPQNISELKSFLGMLNFYGKFVPNLASKPLNPFVQVQKGVRFQLVSQM